jgi:hypothetical protein
MQTTNPILRPFFATALLTVAVIDICGCSDKAAVPPVPIVDPATAAATWEIVGFYGAADDGGTFVRTVEQAPVKVGDRILVTGTGLYDGNWIVLQTFQYKDPMNPSPFWGYRIEPKWQGFPAGFTNDGSVPAGNAAKLQLPLPAEASKPM